MSHTNDPVIVEQDFNQPIQKVWKAITEIEQMKRWFFEQIESFKPEVGFETQFDVHLEHKTYPHLWKLTEVIPPKKITYNWKYGGYPGDSFVTFELKDLGEKIKLTLTHQIVESFPADDPVFSRESTVEGWNYFIKKSLKEYLRNRTE